MNTANVIIIAPTNDAHAGALQWALQRNRVKALWGSSVRLHNATKYSVRADINGIHAFDSPLPCGKIQAIWNRLSRDPEAGVCAPEDRNFIASQWRVFQRNVMALETDFIDTLWINKPRAAELTENKLIQMRAAQKIGFIFPETTVTNDAEDVRRLIDRWGKVVLKTFNRHVWKSRSTNEVHSISVALLDADTVLDERSIAMCPSIYQRYIEKSFDIRVTVLGSHIYSVRILRTDRKPYVDWRNHILDHDVLIEEVALPAAVEMKLRALMDELGLVVGFIDFAVDSDGNFYFLEVNQQGQFLFIEEKLPHLPLLRSMASMLMSGSTAYSIDCSVEARMSDYIISDEYMRLRGAEQALAQHFSYEE